MKNSNYSEPIGLQILRSISIVALIVGGSVALFIWWDSASKANRLLTYSHVVATATATANLPVMYTATWCGQCRRAKEYMALKHIPYHEIDVDTAAGKAGFMNTGERGVPVLVRDGENFVGFSVEYYEAIFGAPRDAIKTPGAS